VFDFLLGISEPLLCSVSASAANVVCRDVGVLRAKSAHPNVMLLLWGLLSHVSTTEELLGTNSIGSGL
jgi:hypothetical protein